MSQTLNPYLNFRGQARDALEFYRSAFGGEVTTMTFAEGGLADQADDPEQLMHGQLETPAGFTVMGSDVPSSMPLTAGENHMTIAVSGTEAEALHGYWDALAVGATVSMALAPAPWGAEYGALVDRFGVPWMFNIAVSTEG